MLAGAPDCRADTFCKRSATTQSGGRLDSVYALVYPRSQSENPHLPFDRLTALSKAEGLRYPHPASLRRTYMYASFPGISEALHLDILHQPLRNRFFGSLVSVPQTTLPTPLIPLDLWLGATGWIDVPPLCSPIHQKNKRNRNDPMTISSSSALNVGL